MENKLLENAVTLDEKIVIYVPATTNTNESVDNSGAVDRAAALLSGLFGGATIQPGAGCWMSEKVGLVKEATTLVYAFTNSDGMKNGLPAVVDFVKALKVEMSQEAMSLEVGGKLYLL